MQFTTQRRQSEEFRRLKKEERLAFYKHAFQISGNCLFVGLVIFAPGLGAALGWIKN